MWQIKINENPYLDNALTVETSEFDHYGAIEKKEFKVFDNYYPMKEYVDSEIFRMLKKGT